MMKKLVTHYCLFIFRTFSWPFTAIGPPPQPPKMKWNEKIIDLEFDWDLRAAEITWYWLHRISSITLLLFLSCFCPEEANMRYKFCFCFFVTLLVCVWGGGPLISEVLECQWLYHYILELRRLAITVAPLCGLIVENRTWNNAHWMSMHLQCCGLILLSMLSGFPSEANRSIDGFPIIK